MSLFQAKQYERQTKAIEEKYTEMRAEAEKAGITLGLNSKNVPQWVKDDRLSEFGTVLFDDYLEMGKCVTPPANKAAANKNSKHAFFSFSQRFNLASSPSSWPPSLLAPFSL